jgi:cobyrinic acid a,c-diamide synthase
VALDDAFHFYYEDSLDLLRACGAELLPFSPLRDERLPEGTQAVYLGGGFPEVFAAELAANLPIRAALRAAAAAGAPLYGECGGLMYLGQGIADAGRRRHPMVGVLPHWSTMDRPRVTLGYRIATAQRPTVLLPEGDSVRGHEFHWSVLDAPPPPRAAAYRLASATGHPLGFDGFTGGPRNNVLASYVHVHFGAQRQLAPAFVAAAAGSELTVPVAVPSSSLRPLAPRRRLI